MGLIYFLHGSIRGPGPAYYVQVLPSSLIVWVCNGRKRLAATASKRPHPSLPFHCSAPLCSSADDKEMPINMMERVVNLRPDDSGQTLVHCCSPSASERQEYEAPSLSSCTGNEMWNEMSRYNRRAASLVHLLFKTDQRRDCWGGSSPRAVMLACLLSYQHKLAVLVEKSVYLQCFFIFRLYR